MELCRLPILVLVIAASSSLSHAQTVAGPWVEAAEVRIERHRMTDLRVIVLDDAGRIVPGAAVRIEQVRHDFPLGVVLHGPSIAGFNPEAEGWRCVNAVSLRRLSAWPSIQPSGPDDFAVRELEAAVTWAELFGLGVHWGGLVSADPAHQPEWAVALDSDARLKAAARLVDVVGFTFAGRVRSATLYTHGLDQRWLSDAQLRWLFHHAQAGRAGQADLDWRLGYEQAMSGERGRLALLDADARRMGYVQADGIAIDHAFERFARDPLDRLMQRLRALKLPTIVDGLEVGGESELEAPANLEAALITLFGEPGVDAIYLDGVTADTARDPAAALFDADGQPTSCGLVLDRLFRQRWWTDVAATTDELGTVRARVFAGRHRVTATLPDGRELQLELWAPRQDKERVVVVEPVWAEAGMPKGE